MTTIKPDVTAKAEKKISDAESASNAKAAFKTFTLKKTSTNGTARTYISQDDNVHEKQRTDMESQLKNFQSGGPGLSVTVKASDAIKLKNSKMDLSQLLSAMEKAKTGTQFYTFGTSLGEQMDNQSRLNSIFNEIKKSKQNGN